MPDGWTRLTRVAWLTLLLAIVPPSRAAAQDFSERLQDLKDLVNQRHLVAADSTGRALLQSLETDGQASSLDAAKVIYLVVEAMLRQGRAGEAECLDLAARSLEIREAHAAGDPPELANGLNQLARLHRTRGQFNEALPYAERSLTILLSHFDADDVEVSAGHNTLGSLLVRLGRRNEARPHFQRVVDIRIAALGPEDPEVADGYNNLAIIHIQDGELEEGARLFERALEIREAALPPDHPLITATLGNLGQLKLHQGQTQAGVELLERALSAQEATQGPDHPDLLGALVGLGSAHQGLQNYGRAREYFRRSVSILEEAYGASHSGLSTPLLGLAQIRYTQGDNEEAIRIGERVAALLEENLGPDHRRVGEVLFELADFYRAADREEDAIVALDRAEEILVASHGRDHPQVAHVHQVYGDVHRDRGESEAALDRYGRARGIWEKTYGPHHRLVGAAVAGLAEVHRDRGDTQEAEALYQEVLEIRRIAWGPQSRYVASALYEQARLLAGRGATTEAMAKALESERLGRAELRRSIRDLDERSGLIYAEARAGGAGLNVALSVAAQGAATQSELDRVWTALIEARAFVLDEMALRTRSLHELNDPALAALHAAYRDATETLARAAVDPTEEDDLDALRRAKESVAQDLARASVAFRGQRSRDAAALDAIADALPDDAALLAFVRYEDEFDDATSYGAFGRSITGDLRFRRLGPASEVDRAVADWLDAAAVGARREVRDEDEAEVREVGGVLRELIWDPLRDSITGAHTVFVTLDGTLNLVNLAALPVGRDEYLVDQDFVVHALSAERDLLAADSVPDARWELLALGDPDFDADPTLLDSDPPAAVAASGAPSVAAFRGPRSGCSGFRGITFGALPASGREVDDIVALWDADRATVPLKGVAANEAAFKRRAPGSRVLHLATHGFFLDRGCEVADASAPDGQRGVGGLAPRDANRRPAAADNPLLRSGLALAGSNLRSTASPDGDDGILTAEEIAALDLRASHWAVLSACETGRGEIQSGEGVLGLQRAFRVAGVRTVIMSLWSVRDQPTLQWMRELYAARAQRGLSTAHSVQAASRALLAERRARGESTHPYYWAAFTAAGDWR